MKPTGEHPDGTEPDRGIHGENQWEGSIRYSARWTS